MKDKNYWAMYYGIPVTLPNKQFYKKIKEINSLAEESAKRFCRKKPPVQKLKSLWRGLQGVEVFLARSKNLKFLRKIKNKAQKAQKIIIKLNKGLTKQKRGV